MHGDNMQVGNHNIAILCISAVRPMLHVVSVCPSICLFVCHIRRLC